jgi:hypothetical protein
MANTLASQLNTNIGQISNTAEQQVGGNNSRTVSAYLTALNGFAVYDVLVVDNGGNLHEFLIDPGNAKVVAKYGLGFGGLGGLASQLNTNIGQISNTVEQQVGNNSRTVSAYLTALNGFAVYDALLVDNGGNLHEFLINPVNGKIALYLTTQALMSNMS